MKTKQLLLAFLMLLVTHCAFACDEWYPSYKYCKFIPNFSMDKLWVFGNATYMTTYPDFISWKIMTWKDADEYDPIAAYRVEIVELCLGNGNDSADLVQLCKFFLEGQQGEVASSLTNYSSTVTTNVKSETDSETFLYFVTNYANSTAIKDLIARSNGNLFLSLYVRYDNDCYFGSEWYGPYNSALQASDKNIVSNYPTPTVRNITWVSDSLTRLRYDCALPDTNCSMVSYLTRVTERGITKTDPYIYAYDDTTFYHHSDFLDNYIAEGRTNEYGFITFDLEFLTTYTANTTGYSSWSYPTSTTLSSVPVTVQAPALAQAENLTVTDNQNGTITLRWQVDSTDITNPYDTTPFVVERTIDNFGTNHNRSFEIPFVAGQKEYILTDSFSNRMQGNLTFNYNVSRQCASAEDFSVSQQKVVNSDYATLETFTSSMDTATHRVNLDWSYNPGIRNSELTVHITYNANIINVPSDSTPAVHGIQVVDCQETTFNAQLYQGSITISTPRSTVITLPHSDPGIIDTIIVSAGFYNDHVTVNWHIDEDKPYFTDFMITRSEYNSTNAAEQTLGTVALVGGVYDYSYSDYTCVPGVYYIYKVIGLAECDYQITQMSERSALGFAQPYGVVSGQIVYSGNQGVQDVAVFAECEDQYRSKTLSFIASRQPKLEIPADYMNQFSSALEGTFEFYVRVEDVSRKNPLLKLGNLMELYNENNQLTLKATDGASQGDAARHVSTGGALKPGEFTHIAMTYTTSTDNQRTIKVYVNGDSTTSLTFQLASTPGSINIPLNFGCDSSDSTYLTGYMDEIRLWNLVRSEQDIVRYMTTYLTGEENGLSAYYRCDDDVSCMIFDLSKTGNNFNSRHLRISNIAIDDNNTPTMEQLGHIAYTDVNGNYLFRNLPYSDQGTLYDIIPILGIHEFSPSSQPLFFNASANTHNQINFEDVSSFPVSGRVTYVNTNYPVVGCQFLIDGTTLCSKDGNPIQTDANGEYTISVPIGAHFITIQKNSHTFVNGGRYPADPHGVGTTFLFLNEVQNLTFRDSTFLLVTGRVAGGSDEEEKPHGFAQGNATIGKAEIVLGTPGDLYNLNTDTTNSRTFRMPQDSLYGICRSVATTGPAYQNEAKIITIVTDSVTGEFNVMLPPIDYEVRSVDIVNNDEHIQFDIASIGNLELSDKETSDVSYDTAFVDSAYVTFTYSAALDVIHYAEPVMTVRQNFGNLAIGDDSYIYKDEISGFRDTIPLYTIDPVDDEITYTFGNPCFNSGEVWTWQISAYEPYTNYDHQTPLTTNQPFRYGVVTVTNNFAEQIKNTNSLTDTSVCYSGTKRVAVSGNELLLDSTGVTYYSFQVGEPNTLSPFTSYFSIYYQDPDRSRRYDWAGNDNNEAIVLGTKVVGSNYVTKGPDEIFYILRDPVGSASYAEWQSGETVSKTVTRISETSSTTDVTPYIVYGLDMKPLLEIEAKIGMHIISEESRSDQITDTWNFTNSQTVRTSADPLLVGSDADVFIGSGTNRLFGDADQVCINRDTAGNYSVDVREVLSIQTEFATQFNYSQYYIESTLIPDLESLRNQLLIQVPASQYDTSYVNLSNDPIYITTLAITDTAYGHDGTYLMILPESWKTDASDNRIFEDEVYSYNNQIQRWIDALAHNERCKVMVHNSTASFNRQSWENVVYGTYSDVFHSVYSPSVDSSYHLLDSLAANYGGGWLIQNYSLGAGSSLSVNETREFTNLGNGVTESDGFSLAFKGDATVKVCGGGVQVSWEVLSGDCSTTVSGTTSGNSSSVTYNVEIGIYDALSFDVYQSPDGFGPIFATRGGQTSCPYLDQEVTRYFQPGTEIQAATTPTAEPRITVQNPVISNIPTGGSAYFNIELANLSSATNARTLFLLSQGTASNPYSALIKVNGHELTQAGTNCYLYGGEVANKIIELSQGSPDILDYDSIELIFSTECDFRDADTVYLSAHFVETCAEIALETDYNILNNTTGNTVEFTIKDFDQQFRNLYGIELQYQRVGDTEWHLLQDFPADSSSHIVYDFTFTKPTFPDGVYNFRAVTTCQYGNQRVTNESDVATVIVDMAAPESNGQPYPLNGIYTANNQVYVDFNEPIQTGRVLSDNVEVEGILNGHPVDHSVSLLLDQTTAMTSATYNLTTTPFTLEMWLNYSQPGRIFSYANRAIEFSIDDSGNFEATINGNTYTSPAGHEILPDQWGYLIVQCDVDSGIMGASFAYDAFIDTLFKDQPIAQCSASGNIIFGGDSLVANVHEVSLWNKYRTTTEALSERSTAKDPYTANLLSLWHLDEGKGFVGTDDIRQRNLTLTDDSWAYRLTNYAMHIPAGDSATVNLSEVPIVSGDNFVVEFWFRAVGDAVLCSMNPLGMQMSIANGNLVVAGCSMPITNYLDNAWHHLAVIRPKNAAPIVAIDGTQLASSRLTTLPDFTAAFLVFGSSANTNPLDIDEIRVWDAQETLSSVRQLIGTRIAGDEAGLTAYYPMEHYVTDEISSQTSQEFTLEDQCQNVFNQMSVTHTDSANSQASTAPSLLESRPVEYVGHTFTVSEDRITVNITESAQRIEGCTLEVTVKDIVDEQGNYSDPIRWTVFVNRNQLLWDVSSVETRRATSPSTYAPSLTIVKDELADTTITLTIVNNSSVDQYWSISGVPSCITLSETSGIISPLQRQDIACTIDATADRGENEYILTLTGNENISTPLYITTNVYANRPDWEINPSDYANSMDIVAYAVIDGLYADDEEDMVAAFIDGELAGVTNLELLPAMGRHYIMMTIYHGTDSASTSISGEEVTFRYWDASTGVIYSNARTYRVVDDTTFTPITITYQDNQMLGNIVHPIRLEMGEEINQSIDLNGGWNWISYNVEPSSLSFSSILNPYLSDFTIIKSQTGYAVPDTAADKVRGSIGSMDCTKGYKIKTVRPFEVNLTGFATSLDQAITFPAQQWKWFGYLPQKALTVNQAMSDINPTVGDVVKSQTQFATWDGYQWVGKLKYMVPGKAYLYYNIGNSDITFTYPAYAETAWQMPGIDAASSGTDGARSVSTGYFEPIDPGKYQGNMSVTAVVKYSGNEVTTAEIGIFAGTECRASATYDDGYYFISVPGDSAVQLTVKVLYNDSVYTVSEQIQYQNDALIGTLTDPYVIDLAPVDPGTGVTVVPADPTSGDKVQKVLINNEVFIIRNGVYYDMQGRRRDDPNK